MAGPTRGFSGGLPEGVSGGALLLGRQVHRQRVDALLLPRQQPCRCFPAGPGRKGGDRLDSNCLGTGTVAVFAAAARKEAPATQAGASIARRLEAPGNGIRRQRPTCLFPLVWRSMACSLRQMRIVLTHLVVKAFASEPGPHRGGCRRACQGACGGSPWRKLPRTSCSARITGRCCGTGSPVASRPSLPDGLSEEIPSPVIGLSVPGAARPSNKAATSSRWRSMKTDMGLSTFSTCDLTALTCFR